MAKQRFEEYEGNLIECFCLINEVDVWHLRIRVQVYASATWAKPTGFSRLIIFIINNMCNFCKRNPTRRNASEITRGVIDKTITFKKTKWVLQHA